MGYRSYDAIRRAADSGLGVLLVEHKLPFVYDLADTVTVLNLGQTMITGPPAAVQASKEVSRVYVGMAWSQFNSAER